MEILTADTAEGMSSYRKLGNLEAAVTPKWMGIIAKRIKQGIDRGLFEVAIIDDGQTLDLDAAKQLLEYHGYDVTANGPCSCLTINWRHPKPYKEWREP